MPSVENIASAVRKVNGVLLNNKEVRNRMLSMNRGKYSMYTEKMSPAIGEYYEIRDFNSPTPITGGESLSEYTYNKKEDYGKSIVDRYRISNWEEEQYSVAPRKNDNLYSNGSNTYLDYVDSVYGDNSAWLNSLENILSIVSMESALNKDQVGVIRNPRVFDALNGVVTTNPNYRDSDAVVNVAEAIYQGTLDPIKDISLSDTDTALGLITNRLYANTLYNGAKFNSARGRDGNSRYPYITPSLFSVYGNNLSNITKLSDIFWIDQDLGRNRDNFSGRVMELSEVDKSNNGYSDIIVDQFIEGYRTLEEETSGALATKRYNPLGSTVLNSLEGFYLDGYYGYENGEGIPIGYTSSTVDYTTNFRGNKSENIGNRLTEHRIYTEYNLTKPKDDESGDEVVNHIQSGEFDNFHIIDNDDVSINNSLIGKTSKMFRDRKINTMIARFSDFQNTETSTIDTVPDSEVGRSHGRQLKKAGNLYDTLINGQVNPYCRTWTFHHQYDRYSKAIRPWNADDEKKLEDTLQNKKYRTSIFEDSSLNGSNYLTTNTVLHRDTNLVRITPYRKNEDKDNKGSKRYMLSIENLAWKDFYGDIENIRRGPNGGRIMWFPPYDLDFQENVRVDWNANTFIGRGEKVYTYSNTDRTAQLGFTILIDHPSIINTLQNYNGVNNDADGDILRFFAGCSMFEEKEGQDESEDNKNNKKPEEGVEITNNGESITFYVFFPNNYSGHMESMGSLDEDWVYYLLFGENAGFPAPENGIGNGYEMIKDYGVTNKSVVTEDNIYKVGIQSCKSINKKDCTKCVPLDDKEMVFLYRVDCNKRAQKLQKGNYEDTTSYRLNSDLEEIRRSQNITNPNYSFAQVYAAICKKKGNTDGYELIKNKIPSSQAKDIDTLAELLRNVKFFEVAGGATKQDPVNSPALAKQRGEAVVDMLKENFDAKQLDGIKIINFDNDRQLSKIINGREERVQRCAAVTLYYNQPNVSNFGNQNDSVPTAPDDGETKVRDKNGNPIGIDEILVSSDKSKEGLFEYEYFSRIEKEDPLVFKAIKQKYQYFDPAFHSMSPEGFNARLNFLHQCTRQGHTISASEVTADRMKVAPTAGNLSFGRMPVCVLRIGDFINTRMIIESMTITYSTDGITWDLNPEGIGVQPNFAKVSMGVVLLGGSALNMPVNRLQNANTFDYYANTGVYDPRADRPKYNGDNFNGDIQYDKLYEPMIDK